MNKDLKPCPFCGRDAALLSNSFNSPFLVACFNCEVTTQMCSNEFFAIEAWNTRA